MAQTTCKTTSQAKAMEKAIAESSKHRSSATPSHSDAPSTSSTTSKTDKSKQPTSKTSTLKPSEKRKPPPDPVPGPSQSKRSKQTKSKTPAVPPQQVSEPGDLISVGSPSDNEGLPSHQPVSQSPTWDERVDRLTSSPNSPLQHSISPPNPSTDASPEREEPEPQPDTVPYSMPLGWPPRPLARYQAHPAYEAIPQACVDQSRAQHAHRVDICPDQCFSNLPAADARPAASSGPVLALRQKPPSRQPSVSKRHAAIT